MTRQNYIFCIQEDFFSSLFSLPLFTVFALFFRWRQVFRVIASGCVVQHEALPLLEVWTCNLRFWWLQHVKSDCRLGTMHNLGSSGSWCAKMTIKNEHRVTIPTQKSCKHERDKSRRLRSWRRKKYAARTKTILVSWPVASRPVLLTPKHRRVVGILSLNTRVFLNYSNVRHVYLGGARERSLDGSWEDKGSLISDHRFA